jgi:hypothetical protein
MRRAKSMNPRSAAALRFFAITLVGMIGSAALLYFYAPNPFANEPRPSAAPLERHLSERAARERLEGERDKIAALLDDLASTKAVFVRNGTEYSGTDAADHLRRKLKAAGENIRTAEEFIDLLATRSSASGEAYLVRDGGNEQPSAEWFRDRLAILQQSLLTNDSGGRKAISVHAEDGAGEVLAFLRAHHERFRIVESNEIEFYSGSALARRIDFKYTLAGRPKLSVDDFIEQFCTTSSLHGTEYQIDREPPRALAEWLRSGIAR